MRVILFLLVITFSIRNTEPVFVKWLPGLQVQTPLVVALLCAFLAGAVFAWLALLPSWVKAKRSASLATKSVERLEREMAQMQQSITTANAPISVEPLSLLPLGPAHGI